MKKYFLIIVLLSFVFLWLGNSYVSAACEDKNAAGSSSAAYLREGHTFTCEVDSPRNAACPDTSQTCVGAGNSCTTAGSACCICNPPLQTMPTIPGSAGGTDPVDPILAPTGVTPPCGGDVNAHMNDFGKCTCNDGYKAGTEPCQKCSDPGVCCGIQLNTSVPFIGNCIESSGGNVGSNEEKGVTSENAFPVLMGSLSKILVTAILIVSFVLILIGGIMIATGDLSGGKSMIIKVVIGIAILGASGVILRLINPNFFG